MQKALVIIIGLVLIASFGFGETIVSVVGTSVSNSTEIQYAQVPINLTNTDAVAGIQFNLKDVPNQLSVAAVSAVGRTAAEPLEDTNNDGIWTPGETYTDLNENGQWDAAFNMDYSDHDSTVVTLIYSTAGNVIDPGNGPVAIVYFEVPPSVGDEIIDLRFHEFIGNLLVVSDPDGNAMNTTWLNGFLTVGGIEVNIGAGGGTPGYLSAPIEIEMLNSEPVKGIQFNIVDAVDYLTIASVEGLGRAADFTFVGNEVAGQSMVLGVNFTGGEIVAGSDAILRVVFMVDANAPTDGTIELSLSQLIVAAEGGIPLPSNGGTGVFSLALGTDENSAIPENFELSQNYPNPFNPTTTIAYSVPEASDVRVGIYNLLGQEIRTLAVGEHQPGFYSTLWDGLDENGIRVESGVYLYRMSSSAGFGTTKKLVLLK